MSLFDDAVNKLNKVKKDIIGKVTNIKPRIANLIGLGLDVEAEVDAAIRVILDDSFLKVIDRAIFALHSTTDKISQEFEGLVEKIFDDLSDLVRQVDEIIEKFFVRLSDLIQDIKRNLVDPIVDSIFALEEKIFEDINQVLDKIFDFFTGTIQQFKDDLFVIFNPLPNPFDRCRQQLGLALTPNGRLTHIDLFNLFECHQLRRLDDNNTIVKEIQEIYAMLQLQSFRLTCLGRGSPAFQEIYLRKWLKYGQLFEIWQEFNENMTPQQAYDEAIRRLNQARDEYQAKVPDIDRAQNTANAAQQTANAAQQTANSAVANSVKNIKFFTVTATKDTTNQASEVTVVFPERVDAVALESIINDGHDMWVGRIDKINETTFKVSFRGARGEGVRWIPSLRFLGIQLQR
jgi:virulence-associated protein VapD